ncbi:TlpA disulfide reductase family protein [Frateuria soli]|uniref:TlpA disulfide reductase family protein n=1 Tax=Frateuria soli TaxID=1542730 RepID=UPI001E28BC0F|nr:TlpA disulfide reductase family protein [Frateuria soli]UGB39548.1 TlpA family protein disulfide reductase [Frateuria soli]
MQSIPLGPLALPLAGLLVLAGVVTALLVDSRLQRRGRPSVEPVVWRLLLAGVLAARIAFVLRWWSEYREHPLGVLDLRDGGLSPWAGALAVLVGAAVVGWRRRALRTPLAWAVLGGLLVWGFGSLVAWRLSVATHAPLPALVLHDLEDRPRPLQALADRPLVINLWASWCGPCRREMPMLAQAQAQKQYASFRFVFANQGESPAEIRAFLAQSGLALDGVLADPSSQLSQHFGVRGYPTTLFFDAQGTLRSTRTGELSSATLAAELRHIADGRAPATPGSPGVLR